MSDSGSFLSGSGLIPSVKSSASMGSHNFLILCRALSAAPASPASTPRQGRRPAPPAHHGRPSAANPPGRVLLPGERL
jgi:hypothetical protein